jgi:hypothetical protein
MKMFIIFELYLKQPLTQPQHKIIVTYYTSNHRFAIEIGQWSTTLIHEDTRHSPTSALTMELEPKAHFMAGCPLYNSIRYGVIPLLQNKALDNLSSLSSHSTTRLKLAFIL